MGISKKFKTLGLSLKKESIKRLLELHSECEDDEQFIQLVEQLGEAIVAQNLSTPIITLVQLEPAISQILSTHDGNDTNEENLLSLVHAFDSKRYKYKHVGKQWMEIKNGPIHGNADDLARVFVDRYELLLQRTMRHSMFRQSTMLSGKDANNTKYELTNTSELIGTKMKKCLFGMLCELNEGKIYLQDVHGSIQLDLSQLNKQTLGLFTFNCFVLIEGALNGNTGLFEVDSIGFPPYERRKKTIKTFNNLNFLPFDKQQVMMELEQKSDDDTFVFMSNVYLDQNETFDKLKKLFDGYSFDVDVSPTLFIFMGNFTKKKLGSNPNDMKLFSSLFDKLCDLLVNKYGDTLCQSSDFVFIPGPNDINVGNLLPQPRLLRSLCKKFHEHSENGRISVHFQSNPFRIRFGTQEIVVFRHDLLQKMRRNCVIVPELEESKDMTNHLCKTILDQSHLCPLPLQICPIYWNYSHALQLYPAPHVIILGDADDYLEI